MQDLTLHTSLNKDDRDIQVNHLIPKRAVPQTTNLHLNTSQVVPDTSRTAAGDSYITHTACHSPCHR